MLSCKPEFSMSSRYAKTLTQVREISIGVVIYERENSNQSILTSGSTGLRPADEIVQKLAFPIENSIRYLDWDKSNSFTDPWGNPYFIAWSLDKKDHLASLLVWSFGPDGTNEFGHGDDIFSLNGDQMPWHTKKIPK